MTDRAGRIVKAWSRGAALILAIAGSASGMAAPKAAVPPPPPKTLQWLYGSSEAVALERQTLAAFARFAVEQATRRRMGEAVDSVVLAEGAELNAPRWMPCAAGGPTAVILDIDETSILNTGWNYDAARRGDPPFDAATQKRWGEWETSGVGQVEPMPGAREAIDAIRAADVKVVFLSNRDRRIDGKDIAASTIAALNKAGLGDAVVGDTLFLAGDVAPGIGKDPRRRAVAAKACVVAMAGDQFGDFSDSFNPPIPPGGKRDVRARRKLADTIAVSEKMGRGWYLLPNPAYGPGVAGDYDDLFDDALHWPASAKEPK